MDQSSVLIISDEPAFSRAVTSRWPAALHLLAFTTVGGDLHAGFAADSFDLAVIGGLKYGSLNGLLRPLSECGKPAIFVADDQESCSLLKKEVPSAVVLKREEGWSELLGLIAVQMLLREQAVRRARNAEMSRATLEREAMLGRYMVDIRHTLNNALTAILGNAELMLIEPERLSASAVSQLETIKTHGRRIHEIMQRFSSIEKEMTFVEQQARKDSHTRHTAAACT